MRVKFVIVEIQRNFFSLRIYLNMRISFMMFICFNKFDNIKNKDD